MVHRFNLRFAILLAAFSLVPATSGAAELNVVLTRHYAIHTDLETDLAADLGQRMDVMWVEYAHRLKDFPLPDATKRFDVYLFAHQIDYMKLTGFRLINSGGVYIPSKHWLAAFLEYQGRDGLCAVLQHEAFHQFADDAVGQQLPVWLNEGLAQIFEEGIWTGNRFLIGQVPPARLYQLQSDRQSRRIVDFKDFVAISDQQWVSNMRDRTLAKSQYNQAWAMAQFLVYATDQKGNPLYVDNLVDMLRFIHKGTGGRVAFEAAFSDNYTGFQKRFNDWASTLIASSQATYSEQQSMLADLMIQLYGSGQRFESVGEMRQYLINGGFTVRLGERTITPQCCFYDSDGHALGPEQLFFASNESGSAPDLICRPTTALELRTRFRKDADTLSYETTVRCP